MRGREEKAVDAAMRLVPRERFLPESQVARAHVDAALAIGAGQTSSQPRTVRDMLVLLDVHPGHRVLDVGSGSGWTTALLGHLVGPTGSVVGVELVPELTSWGAANVAACGMPWARVEQAVGGVLGWPDDAPYDRVLVSAEPRSLPSALVDQIEPDGVMVIPVAGRMLRVRRGADGEPLIERRGHYRFVPLLGRDRRDDTT